jgi:hypothetical protein
MALLKQEHRNATSGQRARAGRPRWRTAAASALVVVAGCAIVDAIIPTDPPFAFSHRRHAEEGLECASCHAGAQDSDTPGMPSLAQCKLCHETLDAEKPAKRQVASLFDGESYRAARGNRLDAEVLFSHKQHVGANECGACHQGIETNEVIPSHRTITMAVCTDCHAQKKAANECATCHREIRTDSQPSTHRFGWQRSHGQAYRAHGAATADQCSLCHQESTCASCHFENPPANHNNYFRQRGHGLHARMDRQACSTCHRSDTCDACHQDARPINHAGAWGTPRDNHCVSCHFPLNSSDCYTCHKDAPSHAQATALPPNHNAAMNCRQCHGVSAPLPHVDNGSECTQCHR